MSFRALRVHRTNDGTEPRLEDLTLDALSEGDVVIRGAWSGINYKDALAVTGRGRILRRYPLVAGIDVAGTVESSTDPAHTPGDRVVVTGWGLSETQDGGFAERVRVRGEQCVALPDGLDLREAMILGTAGFTAALAVDRLQHNRQSPADGPIAVTGATGGVGSLAIGMLAGLGFQVHAITGKPEHAEHLRSLGAAEVLDRRELDLGSGALASTRFAGAVDNLGGEMLAGLLRTTRPFGNVASIGLAQDARLSTTVMPLILRGVNLLGINSVLTPPDLRARVWERLDGDLRPAHLEAIVAGEVDLDGIIDACQPLIDARQRGRTLVRIA